MGRLAFPWPPRELAANRRAGVHWGAVQGAKAAYRLECEAIVRSVTWGSLVPGVVPLAVIGYVGKGQRMPDLSLHAMSGCATMVTSTLPGPFGVGLFSIPLRHGWRRQPFRTPKGYLFCHSNMVMVPRTQIGVAAP